MPLTAALKNQVLGRLIPARGNLPSRARKGPSPSDTAGITGQARKGINLSYPLNVEEDEQEGHYIMFMINETTAGRIGKRAEVKNKGADLGSDFGFEAGAFGGFQGKNFIDKNLNIGSGKEHKATFLSAPGLSGLFTLRPATTRMTQAISLYMPPSVKVSYKSNYKNEEIGVIAGGGLDVIEAFRGAGDIAGTLLKAATTWGAAIGKGIADTTAPGAFAYAQIYAGAIVGSKMEVLFTDVGRRNFSFQFIFIPKSEQEARMIYNIVQTFKEHMLPEYLRGLTGKARTQALNNQYYRGIAIPFSPGKLLKIPDTFDIFYFYRNNENPFLNRISTCYLTVMDIDYGGEKYVTYEPTKMGNQEGPPPQRTTISLSFTEIETITKERAEQGF